MNMFNKKGVRFTIYILGILAGILLVGYLSMPIGNAVTGWFNLDKSTWSKIYIGLMTELIVGWIFAYMPYDIASNNYDSTEYGIKDGESNIKYYAKVYVWFYYKIVLWLAKLVGSAILLLLVSYLISYLVPNHYLVAIMSESHVAEPVAKLLLGVIIAMFIMLGIAGLLIAYMIGYALYLFIKFLWRKA